MSEDSLRAGDADREATVARLQQAFTEGRLELAEIDERTAAAYAAKTLGDLAALTRDLPAAGTVPVAPQPRPPQQQQQDRPHDPDIWQWAKFGLPPVIVINFLIWLGIGLSGDWVHPWWIWIMVAWLGGAFGGPGGRGRIGRGGHGRRGIQERGRDGRRRQDDRQDEQWRLDRRREQDEDEH